MNTRLKQLLQFQWDIKDLNPEDRTIYISIKAQPHELTFLQFVSAWYSKTTELIIDGNMPTDPMVLLRKEHHDQVLNALKDSKRLPLTVLNEYRFQSEFFKPIKRYCRVHKIDLDE